MALDASDLYLIHAMGDRNNIRTRAKTLEDNFGVKTQNIEEYRSQHGGAGLMKALGWVIGGLALGAAAAFAISTFGAGAGMASAAIFTGAKLAMVAGAALGGLAGSISMGMQNEKVMSGYSSYLDDVATQARMAKERGVSLNHAHGYSSQRGPQITAEENALLNQRLAEDRSQNERMGLMASAGAAAGR